MKYILATHNLNKVKEIKEMINDKDFSLLSLDDLNDYDEIEETGSSFEENAFIKANYYYNKYKLPVISDDSGLSVDELDGEPGIYSARYAGLNADKDSNNNKLLENLKGKISRKAFFKTVICFIKDSNGPLYYEGLVEGRITRKPYGNNGFGYDSIFLPNGYSKTYGEMDNSEKNLMSHRYKALSKLILDIKINEGMNKANEVLNAECTIVKRLQGGMSNYTYLIKANEAFYTLRILGEEADKFIDRKKELEHIKLFESFNITNSLVYFDEITGLKISKYIEGTPLSEIDSSLYPYDKIVEVLKIIHNIDVKTSPYNFFERLETYEGYLKVLGFDFPNIYNKLKKKLLLYKDYLEENNSCVCHGDSQPSNFIYDGEKLFIVDFEFSGYNNPIYDIACFSNMKLEDGLKLLYNYYNDITDEILISFLLCRIEQAFQWYNVAMYKELKGLSEKLNFNFKEISSSYLKEINKLFNLIEDIFLKKNES